MPATAEALKLLRLSPKILTAGAKASGSGGVAVSALEMAQNAQMLSWTAEEVDNKLRSIMKDIHTQCETYGKEADGYINYVKGANTAGFMKVARAMIAEGIS